MLERLTTDSVLHHQSHVFSFSFSERIPSHDLLFDDQDDDVKEKKRRIVRKIVRSSRMELLDVEDGLI